MNYTIKQIRTMVDKALVEEFQCLVKKVYKRNEGTNAKGPWSVQNLLLEDAEGETIKFALWHQDAFPFNEGAKIVLRAHKGQKGLSGLYAEDETRDNSTTRILRATKTCEILGAGEAAKHEEAAQSWEEQEQQNAKEATQNAPQGAGASGSSNATAKGAQGQGKPATDWKDAKRQLVQIANLHLLAVLAVDRVEAPALYDLTNQQMSESARQAAAASIFIKAERDGLVRMMPTKPLTAADLKP